QKSHEQNEIAHAQQTWAGRRETTRALTIDLSDAIEEIRLIGSDNVVLVATELYNRVCMENLRTAYAYAQERIMFINAVRGELGVDHISGPRNLSQAKRTTS